MKKVIDTSGSQGIVYPVIEVTTRELGLKVGLSVQRIMGLVKEGLPRIAQNRFDLIACLLWFLIYWRDRAERRLDGDYRNAGIPGVMDDRKRLYKIQADAAEHTLLERTNEVCLTEDLTQALFDVLGIVGTQLDELAGRNAAQLAAISEPGIIREVLKGETNRIRSTAADKVEEYALSFAGDRVAAGK